MDGWLALNDDRVDCVLSKLLVELKNSARCDRYSDGASTFYPLKNPVKKSIFHKYRTRWSNACFRPLFTSGVKCTLHFRVSRVLRLVAIVFKCNVLATYTYVRTWLAIVAAPCTLTIIARSMHSIEDDKVHWYRFCANILISSSSTLECKVYVCFYKFFYLVVNIITILLFNCINIQYTIIIFHFIKNYFIWHKINFSYWRN